MKLKSRGNKKVYQATASEIGVNSPIRVGERGFTLIEMLLSIAIIAILAGLSVPVYQELQVRNSLDIAQATTAQTLRRAQVLSQAVSGDAKWGVRIAEEKITLFRGDSFAGRDTGFDESFEIPSPVSFSGTTEFVFTRMTGRPEVTGTVTFSTDNEDDRSLTVNEYGMITY